MRKGISVEAKEIVRKVIRTVGQYLAGNLEVDGVKIQGGSTLTLRIRLDADSIRVAIDEPRPVISKGLLKFFQASGDLTGITVNESEAVIEIDGLPDPTIELT